MKQQVHLTQRTSRGEQAKGRERAIPRDLRTKYHITSLPTEGVGGGAQTTCLLWSTIRPSANKLVAYSSQPLIRRHTIWCHLAYPLNFRYFSYHIQYLYRRCSNNSQPLSSPPAVTLLALSSPSIANPAYAPCAHSFTS